MNPNQYGFTPKKSTTDATLAVKEYIEEGFRQGHIPILITLDVQGHLMWHGGRVYYTP